LQHHHGQNQALQLCVPSCSPIFALAFESDNILIAESQVYARVQVDVTDIELKLKELSKQSGKKVTLTTLVSWALAKYVNRFFLPFLKSRVTNASIHGN
jgi:hypothetical protein